MRDFQQRALAILGQDRTWAAYAIADLQPAFAPDCVWSLRDCADGASAVLLYYGLTVPVLFTFGAPAGLAASLDHFSQWRSAR